MTQGHLDRSKAARIAGMAKIAFAAVAACGIVATMMLGRGEIPSPQGPLTLVELPPLANTQNNASTAAPVDNVGIVERFELIANAPAKPVAATDAERTIPHLSHVAQRLCALNRPKAPTLHEADPMRMHSRTFRPA